MAIDFPNSPIEGQTYDFGGTRYTFTLIGGAPGYWKVLEPGLAGPANTAEINAGIISDKFIAPDALDASAYMRNLLIGTNNATFQEVPKDEVLNFNAGGVGGLQIAQGYLPGYGVGVNINTLDAGTTQKGVTRLSSDVNSPATDRAATPAAVKTAYDTALASGWNSSVKSAAGRVILSNNFADAWAGGGIMLQWGKVSYGGVYPTRRTVVFPQAFGECYGVMLQPIEPDGVEVNTATVKLLSPTSFDMLLTSGNLYIDFMWIAYGRK